MHGKALFLALSAALALARAGIQQQIEGSGQVNVATFCGGKNKANSVCLKSLMDSLVLLYKGGTIFFPPGTYTLDSTTLRDNVKITGFGASNQYRQNQSQNHVTLITPASPDQAYVFKLANGNLISNISFWGTKGKRPPRALYGGQGCVVTQTSIVAFDVGWDANYKAPNQLTLSRIYGNSIGIKNFTDGTISQNFIHSNDWAGIYLASGANENTIDNNRIEHNNGYGIHIYSASHNLITNNIIDRNFWTGILINACEQTVVSNNQLQRNGYYSASSKEKSHIYAKNSKRITFFGNMTQYGPSDSLKNPAPEHSLVLENSDTTVVKGNDWLGSDPAKKHFLIYNSTYSDSY